MLSPSVLNSTAVPRSWRICLLVRLIMPWRLPRWANSTLPPAVTLKRFLAPDFVFILGIWLSFRRPRAQARPAGFLLVLSVLIEHFAAATAALSAGRREAGVMAEACGKYNQALDSQPNRRFSGSPILACCGLRRPWNRALARELLRHRVVGAMTCARG